MYKVKSTFNSLLHNSQRTSILRSAALILLNCGQNLGHVTNASSNILQAKFFSLFAHNGLQRLHASTALLKLVWEGLPLKKQAPRE